MIILFSSHLEVRCISNFKDLETDFSSETQSAIS